MGWNYLSIPKCQRLYFDVWEWISNFTPHIMDYTMDYLSMVELKLIHISKGDNRETEMEKFHYRNSSSALRCINLMANQPISCWGSQQRKLKKIAFPPSVTGWFTWSRWCRKYFHVMNSSYRLHVMESFLAVNWLRPSDAYRCLSKLYHHWFR